MNSELYRSKTWKVLQLIARFAGTMMFDLKVFGTKNIPKAGGVLLVANHQSYLDPVLVAVRLQRPVNYFAKSELFDNRYLGWLIRKLHAFPVRQGEGDIGAVKETIRRLGEGYVLNIYPEGTRSLDGEIAPIEKGVALIVRRANVPIVPVAIDGSFQAYSKGRKFPRAYPIRVMYGPPMDMANLKADEIVKLIDRTLRKMLNELREMRAKEIHG